MAKEWKVKCKNFEKCGNYLKYSDRAYRHSLQYGFSRPEYCEDCQKEQVELRKSLPVPYVPTEASGTAIDEGFGQLYRGDRAHHMTEAEGTIDRDLYGLTPAKIGEIAERVKEGKRVIIVVGETGSGKSTLLPAWMMDPPAESGVDADFFTKDGQIGHSQPRIFSTTSQARYIGEVLMGGHSGKGMDTGYNYSGEKNADWRNAHVSMTDGTLINEVKKGKLGQYGYIIIDEAHERSENIDRLLNLLKDRLSMFPKLKLIIASATIDAEKFQTHFGSDVAAIVEFEGKQRFDREGNPVSYERIFRDPDNALPYDDPARLGRAVGDTVVSETMDLLRAMVDENTPKGDVLIFLQGVKPIDTSVEQLRSRIKQDDQLEQLVKVMPLYRNLDQKDKERVRKHNPDDGNIWVIVSTNIAEASVTIDSLVYEIETGVENQKQFDSETGETSLPLTIISKANAKQRWGRVGRTRNGIVYCLYTEDQFMNLFPEHPTPAVQRSSMEESLVTLKAAGAPDPSLGWLDAPRPAELERAQHALVDHGSVTAEGTLTWYGFMMQNFSYSTQLKELLIAADSMGCVVEAASILLIIQNGGYRRILSWNHRWDAYTKFAATKKHDALMAGCRDDVEFTLKIIRAYTDLPWVSREAWKKLSDAEKRALGKEWAIANFVDYDVLKTILKEREKALAMFFDKSKEDVRPIDLTLINRVRFLLKRFLPGVTIRQSDQPYRFRRIVEPEKGSAVTCEIVWPFSDLPSGDAEWLDTGYVVHQSIPIPEDIAPIVSRLFLDQVYPIGGILTAKIETDQTGKRSVTTISVFSPETYAEEYETEENGVGEDVPDEEAEDEKQEPEGKTTQTLADLPVQKEFFLPMITFHSGSLDEKNRQVEIVGYDFTSEPSTIITKPIPNPKPFEAFVRSFNPDDDIEVEIIGLLSHPDDRDATALIVREVTTGLEMLVEPNELSFTTSARVIEEMPQGKTFTMTVDRIIEKAQRVHLTLLPQTEASITEHLTDERGREGKATVEAWVVQILANSVMFVIGWDWGQGAAKVVQVYEDWLPKPPSEYTLWEEVLVTVFQKTNGVAHASLPNLPDKVRSSIEREETELTYEHGTLYFKGRMTADQLFELKASANDRAYHRALNELYWRSNKLLVDSFADATWYRWAKETYPVEATVQATITEVSRNGLNVMVDETSGFIPRSLVTRNERADITRLFTVGDTVEAKVVEIRPDQKELILRCDHRTVSSLGITEGDKVNGVITGMKDRTGLFVRLVSRVAGGAIVIPFGPGIDAFAPERYVFHGNYALSALFQEGQEVIGEVLSVDDERGIAISLKTPENDPFFRLQQGMEIRGTIKTVNPNLGIFIEVAPGVDGLLHNRSLQRLDQATLDQMVPGSQVTVSIFKMDAEKRNVNLNFVRL